MISTEFFRQLCPSPLWRIRNQFRHVDRRSLPISPAFLMNYGVPEESVRPLMELTLHDRVSDMMAVAVILLQLFEEEPLHSRCGLLAWMRRRGGCPPHIEAAAKALAQKILDEEEDKHPADRIKAIVKQEKIMAYEKKKLLLSANDKMLRLEEPK